MRRINDSKNCKYCGKLFRRKDLKGIVGKKWINRKYCSRECLFKEGISEEVKKKMSLSMIGKKKPHTKEWKEKISKIMLGKVRGKYKHISEQGLKNLRAAAFKRRGENASSWKGGTTLLGTLIRNSFTYRQWRDDVFTRDNYTCIWCGDNKGGNLNADHIKPFSVIIEEHNIKSKGDAEICEELWNINNGRTLCESCHKKTDTWGRKSFNYNESK